MALIILVLLVSLPVVLSLLFRVNALYIFVSICAGYLLQSALSDDVDLALATVVQGSDSMVAARLGLLLIPPLVTVFILRKTMGKSILFQLVPLIFSGMLLTMLALPLLPPGMDEQVYASDYGASIRSAEDLIIAAAVVSNLSLMFVLFKKREKRGKHH